MIFPHILAHIQVPMLIHKLYYWYRCDFRNFLWEFFLIIGIAIAVIQIVAMWKIFTKTGEKDGNLLFHFTT